MIRRFLLGLTGGTFGLALSMAHIALQQGDKVFAAYNALLGCIALGAGIYGTMDNGEGDG